MHLSPLRYPGGKSKFSRFLEDVILLNNLENSKLFELYAGGAGASLNLLSENICKNIYLNDFDFHIYSFWHSILNNSADFSDKISNVSINIEEWKKQKFIYENYNQFEIFEIGFSTFFLNRTNRSGILKAGPIGGFNQTGKYLIDVRFNREQLIKKIQKIAELKNAIEISNLESLELLADIFKVNTKNDSFLFLDPPYYNQGENLYLNFYKREDHKLLSEMLRRNRNRNWILTYDNCTEILDLYKGFRFSYLPMKYSLESKRSDKEIMIFSDSLLIPQNLNIGTYKNKLEVLTNE